MSLDDLRAGLDAGGDLDERQGRRGIEEVGDQGRRRVAESTGQPGDRERGGVGTDDGVLREDLVEGLEHRTLGPFLLEHRLHDEVDLPERTPIGAASNASEDLGALSGRDLRSEPLSEGVLLLLREREPESLDARRLPGGPRGVELDEVRDDRRDALKAGGEPGVVGFLQLDGDTVERKKFRDRRPHRSGPDHSRLGDAHSTSTAGAQPGLYSPSRAHRLAQSGGRGASRRPRTLKGRTRSAAPRGDSPAR